MFCRNYPESDRGSISPLPPYEPLYPSQEEIPPELLCFPPLDDDSPEPPSSVLMEVEQSQQMIDQAEDEENDENSQFQRTVFQMIRGSTEIKLDGFLVLGDSWNIVTIGKNLNFFTKLHLNS